jgi:hypothetical protein
MPVTLQGNGQLPVQVVQTVKTDTFSSSTSGSWVDKSLKLKSVIQRYNYESS